MKTQYKHDNPMQNPLEMPWEIQKCDSVTLSCQKFPDIKGYYDPKEKLRVLQKLCRNVERSKEFIENTNLLLPAISKAVSFCGTNKGRLLVNHTGGVLEGGNIALHRFFGCPVIPGSALKGIARSTARFDEDKERFARVFGGESDQAGSVSFLMAIPEKTDWKLTVDVLTSHGGCDTKNPVPVFFPAVETGATFRFTVAPTARTKDGDIEFAIEYLKQALTDHGVGAKTAAGYGWFSIKENVK